MKGLLLATALALGVAAQDTPEEAALGLLGRVLPAGVSASFEVEIAGPANGSDWFAVANAAPGKIKLSGNSAGSVAMGLNWYLKYVGNSFVSWDGDRFNITATLPAVASTVNITRPYKYGYYQNVCTVSYTMAWFDWARWQREIDWMAMNGINIPLAFSGQEYVWTETFKLFGLTYQDLEPFFSGPAFFAWQRMGNLRGWGGPLPYDFVVKQRDLQVQILARMRSLGMKPILPAFAGHIPEAFVKKFPNVGYTRSPVWSSFEGQYGSVYYLNNTDPMFVSIGQKFIETQRTVFGTDHLYNGDQYNEMAPPTNDSGYIKNASAAMYTALSSADPEAIWVMQGWLFVDDPGFWTASTVEAYLSSVPNNSMLILDLFSEVVPAYNRTSSYFGKPFIWNMLHNFGGNDGMYGRMPTVTSGPSQAKNSSNTIVGVGLTPEGTLQNYVMYDLMMENTWRSAPVPSLRQWVIDYATRRYGKATPGASAAWTSLQSTVYDAPSHFKDGSSMWSVTKSIVTLRPSMSMEYEGFMPTALYYDPAVVVSAFKSLLNDSSTLGDVSLYKHDVVDFGRQALSNLMLVLNQNHTDAYNSKDGAKQARVAALIRSVISDLDDLLSSHENFLLGTWIAAARAWGDGSGSNATGAAYYEWNARNQVTLWGPHGEIHDYAAKQWGGLVRGYYAPRWDLYLTAVNKSFNAGVGFNSTAFNNDCLALEQSWQHASEPYPAAPAGDTIEIAQRIAAKYF